jgi:hypothetical protein
MSDQTAFAVPKDRLGVTVRLGNGVVIEGDVFLEYAIGDPAPHDKVVAFLEEGADFFPIRVRSSGSTEFVHKSTVRIIEIAHSGAEGYFPPGSMHAFSVTVYFNYSSTLYGKIVAEVPMEKARLSDCLNQPGMFITLQTDSKMCYLNKDTICKVVQEKEL